MGIEIGVFLTFGGILILIFLLGRALLIPIKLIAKILLNSIIGAALIFVINITFGSFGIIIPINIINSVTVGILGVPGVILLLVLCN